VGRSTRLGHENEPVCIVSGGYRDGRFVTKRGVSEGINAGWVAHNKIVCMWWQMGVIGRGKGCRDNLSCVRAWCPLRCEGIVV